MISIIHHLRYRNVCKCRNLCACQLSAHFKWTGRLHTLHLMEFASVNLLGKSFKQMMQKSMSSSDCDDSCVLHRLAGGVVFGVAFFANLAALSAAFFLKTVMFSGEVSSALFIAFRPLTLLLVFLLLAERGYNVTTF